MSGVFDDVPAFGETTQCNRNVTVVRHGLALPGLRPFGSCLQFIIHPCKREFFCRQVPDATCLSFGSVHGNP